MSLIGVLVRMSTWEPCLCYLLILIYIAFYVQINFSKRAFQVLTKKFKYPQNKSVPMSQGSKFSIIYLCLSNSFFITY